MGTGTKVGLGLGCFVMIIVYFAVIGMVCQWFWNTIVTAVIPTLDPVDIWGGIALAFVFAILGGIWRGTTCSSGRYSYDD